MNRTLVIVECGSCHDGDFLKAMRLVEAVADVGADVAKFQYWSDSDALADRRKVPDYYREIYRRYQMPVDWMPALHQHCERVGIEWACTTYLPQDIATVAPFVKRFKVSSFEAEDVELVASHIPYLRTKELIVSLGMGARAPHELPIPFQFMNNIRTLHCVSAYPAPSDALNLQAIRPLDGCDGSPTYDGFSDHSRHPLVGALAVAAGALIIEAHLRLDDTDPANPDYATAFSPREFAEYVSNIRFAERALGTGEKAIQDCERDMARYRVTGA